MVPLSRETCDTFEHNSLTRHTVRLFSFFAIVDFFRLSPLLLSIHRQRNINLVMLPSVVGNFFCAFFHKIRLCLKRVEAKFEHRPIPVSPFYK